MKKIIAIVCMAWLAFAGAWADNISAENITLQAGGTKTVNISLTNTETNLVGFQMDLTLPDGISINKAGCSLSSRFSDPDQTLTIGKQGDNVYRLTSTSYALTPISGTSGSLLTLSLTASASAQGGIATLSNIRFATSTSGRVTMNDASFVIESSPSITFVDDNVKALCVANWDTSGNGELSEAEAAGLFRANRTSQSVYRNLKLKRLQDIRVFSDYEPRTEDSTMFQSHYIADATVDIMLEILLGFLAPGIGRMIQLQHQMKAIQFVFVQLLGRAHHDKLHVQPLLVVFQPLQATSGERIMQSAPLSQNEHLAWRQSGLPVLQEREIERRALIALAVVARIIPVHASPETAIEHILAFGRQRARVVVTAHQHTVLVGYIRHLPCLIPFLRIAFGQESRAVVSAHDAVTAQSATIERHSQHQFLGRHTGTQMRFNGL